MGWDALNLTVTTVSAKALCCQRVCALVVSFPLPLRGEVDALGRARRVGAFSPRVRDRGETPTRPQAGEGEEGGGRDESGPSRKNGWDRFVLGRLLLTRQARTRAGSSPIEKRKPALC